MAEPAMIISCEHGGNRIPGPYRHLFKAHQGILKTHRGYDMGALALARRMADMLAVQPFVSTTSRLLVDLNRSRGHRQLFSHITRGLDRSQKMHILDAHYTPYRNQLQHEISRHLKSGRTVVHIASHSFTPVFNDKRRLMDIGLLYDPKRSAEKQFCRFWKRYIQDASSAEPYLIRSNAPYKGVSDGITTYFRALFAGPYLGIELELNQRWFLHQRREWKVLCDVVLGALRKTVASLVV